MQQRPFDWDTATAYHRIMIQKIYRVVIMKTNILLHKYIHCPTYPVIRAFINVNLSSSCKQVRKADDIIFITNPVTSMGALSLYQYRTYTKAHRTTTLRT